MVEEPESDEEGPESNGGWLKKLIDRLTTFQKFLATATATVVAVGALVAAVLGVLHLIGQKSINHPTASPTIVTGDSSPLPPTTALPTSSSPSAPSPTPSLNISVTCQLPGPVREGQQTTATYKITSNQVIKVGLGMSVYDSGGTDHSNGNGDMDGYQLVVGTQTVKRELLVPSGLAADQYEIDAEIWPNGKIGAGGADTLAEATCGFFNVP